MSPKRLFDLTFVLLTLPLVIPLAAIVGVAVFLFLGRPILFSQQRPGLCGRPFTMYKFRTMRPQSTQDQDDASRLTRFGSLLRRSSLDELPELWNVLRGEMSLVGPRPLLMEYLSLYTADQARRHNVLPGITGWAQINGRNAISWQEKFDLDLWYVENRTLWLDTKILFETAFKVARGTGVAQEQHATVERFRGNKHE